MAFIQKAGAGMRVAFILGLIVVWSLGGLSAPVHAEEAPALEVVAEMDQRPGNIAVAVNGRIFVTLHPFDAPATKLVEIGKGGEIVPFPSKEWNEPIDNAGIGFVNILGIRGGPTGMIYVLDMGDNQHSPRMLEFDLGAQRVGNVRYIPVDVTTDQSFLQDFTYDWEKGQIFIADMGQKDLTKPAKPGIIMMNLVSGWALRRLDGFDGIGASQAPLTIQGREIKVTNADGKSVAVHPALNSITCDPMTDWVYFAPMGEGKLYRLPLSKFADLSLSDDGLTERIEVLGDKPPSDGITVDAEGNVYIASIAKGEIGVMSKDHPYRTYIKDDRLDWVDGFSYAPDGYIYATISQLDKHPMFNGGMDGSKKPYLIVRFKPIKPAALGR